MYLLNVGYMEWIDDEGTNIVGVDAWSSLDKRFVNSAKPDFRPFQDLQNSKRGIYSIIDEGQMGNIEFKPDIEQIQSQLFGIIFQFNIKQYLTLKITKS